MKRIITSTFAVMLTAAILTSCGTDDPSGEYGSVTGSAISESIPETTDSPASAEASETTETTTVTTTETEPVQPENALTILSESELSDDEKVFFEHVSLMRQKSNAADVVPVKELNECAEIFVSEISSSFSAFAGGTRKDGSDWTTLLDEAGISYANCDKTCGYTLTYDAGIISNSILFSNSAYATVTNSAWKYAGFCYDPKTQYWAVIFISDDAADAVPEPDNNAYFDNSTAFEAFQTYMIALCNDDYNTYLAITEESDNSEAAEKYERRKGCYAGMSPSDIEWWEVGKGTGLGGYGTYFDVVEYDSSGSAKFDINTFGSAYGTVVVSKSTSTGNYYVSVHYNYSPFMTIDKIQ